MLAPVSVTFWSSVVTRLLFQAAFDQPRDDLWIYDSDWQNYTLWHTAWNSSTPDYDTFCGPDNDFCQCYSQVDAWQCPPKVRPYFWVSAVPSDDAGNSQLTFNSAPDCGRKYRRQQELRVQEEQPPPVLISGFFGALLEINVWDEHPHQRGNFSCYSGTTRIANLRVDVDYEKYTNMTWLEVYIQAVPCVANHSLLSCRYDYGPTLKPTNIFIERIFFFLVTDRTPKSRRTGQ
jgi:hypothetical protein